jgi:hypothetical protein
LRYRDLIHEGKSIYLPSTSSRGTGEWVEYGSCVWDGPSCLRYVPRVRDFYSNQRKLFQTIVGMPNADLNTLHREVLHMVPSDTYHIVSVLGAISKQLEEPRRRAAINSGIQDLGTWAMFPVTMAGTDVPAAKTVLRASRDSAWCIPESQIHRDAFYGVVDLSVLHGGEFDAEWMKALREHLDLGSRFVSRSLKRQSSDVSGARRHASYETKLRRKAPYIAEWVCPF